MNAVYCKVDNSWKNITDIYSNPNLLMNSNFQIVQTRKYTVSSGIGADRWIFSSTEGSITISGPGKAIITSTKVSQFFQYVEGDYRGQTMTMSFQYTLNNQEYIVEETFVISDTKKIVSKTSNISIACYHEDDSATSATVFWIQFSNITCTINWTKLEFGPFRTAYSPKTFATEMESVKRYRQTYGNIELRLVSFTTSKDGKTHYWCFNFLKPMRKAPTIEGTWKIFDSNDTLIMSDAVLTVYQIGVYNVLLSGYVANYIGPLWIRPNDTIILNADYR